MSIMPTTINEHEAVTTIKQSLTPFWNALQSSNQPKLGLTTSQLPLFLVLGTQATPTSLIMAASSSQLAMQMYEATSSWQKAWDKTHIWHLLPETITPQELEGDIVTSDSKAFHQLLLVLAERSSIPHHHFIVSQNFFEHPLPDPKKYKQSFITLTKGEKISLSSFVEALSVAKYRRHQTSLEKGAFIVKGESVSIAHPFTNTQYEIIFFGNIVERIITKEDRRSADIQLLSLPPLQLPKERISMNAWLPQVTLVHPTTLTETKAASRSITYNALTPDATFPLAEIKDSNNITQEKNILFYDNLDRASAKASNSTLLCASELSSIPFAFQATDCAFVSESFLFPVPKKSASPISYERALELIGSLEIGKPAVHADHGIGLYEGIEARTINGIAKEYLVLRYAAGDALSVPVEFAHKVTPYIGEGSPAVHRLGTSSWAKTKKRAHRDAVAFAKELLAIARKRAATSRPPHVIDVPVEDMLHASFEYQLTPDQEQTWEEVKADLMITSPMDRLIVGDVGFGKTEIAMRAAAHIAASGKQVAVLAPTTLLVQQHLDTFKKRLPFLASSIASLSRFSSPADMKKVRAGIEEGKVRIAIGTHALLGNSTHWKSLGLIIIDEEQRFGVQQKEHLKKIRGSADMLALSATPIPRTLSMALSGLRGLSIIATAPVGRKDITQFVMPQQDTAIKEALERELERGGQAYVVAPKVRQLGTLREHILALVPKAKIGIAHGQLDDETLSKVIHQFDSGELDILVASSIIENGLDLPTANTILVFNAPHFGLSDLYQLRGRIGRRSTQGYAYFFYSQQQLTDVQRQRLAALTESARVGSGWLIAQRDLEIRGAGNLLGAEQHGTTNAIGVQLYLDMVHQALEHEEELTLPDIQLPIPALIPQHYIADMKERTRWYQRLTRTHNQAEIKTHKERLEKQFGALPQETKNLLLIIELQQAGAKMGISKISTTTITPSDDDPYFRLDITAQNLPMLLARLQSIGNWTVRHQTMSWKTNSITPVMIENIITLL